MAVVTTRAVSEGDELLLSYGHEYWVTRGASEGLPATTAGSDDDAAVAAAAAVQRARAVIQQADPAVRRAAEGSVEHAVTAQAAVALEYAPEIGRFETIFQMAARRAASEGVRGDAVDERRAPGTPIAADAAGGGWRRCSDQSAAAARGGEAEEEEEGQVMYVFGRPAMCQRVACRVSNSFVTSHIFGRCAWAASTAPPHARRHDRRPDLV
jgi:hypothetical protein